MVEGRRQLIIIKVYTIYSTIPGNPGNPGTILNYRRPTFAWHSIVSNIHYSEGGGTYRELPQIHTLSLIDCICVRVFWGVKRLFGVSTGCEGCFITLPSVYKSNAEWLTGWLAFSGPTCSGYWGVLMDILSSPYTHPFIYHHSPVLTLSVVATWRQIQLTAWKSILIWLVK